MKKLILIILILFSFNARAEGTLISWGPKDLVGMTQERFEDAKKWSKKDILAKNLNVNDWPETYLLLVASMQYKDDKSFINELIAQISNNKETKLHFTTRLIIWGRITTGDILFEGKGIQIDDDLFKVSGRANFILRNITTNNYGIIFVKNTQSDSDILQNKWLSYSKGEKLEQYKNPFDGLEKGLNETHSLEAFEALVYSLKPSNQKDELTKNCLKTIYKLDEMPKDKGNSANFCNPDNYTFTYLSKLIGEKTDETKDYIWWTNWWKENKDKLKWNAVRSIFEIKKQLLLKALVAAQLF
jgi:hypothetical protein